MLLKYIYAVSNLIMILIFYIYAIIFIILSKFCVKTFFEYHKIYNKFSLAKKYYSYA